jgi:hypothetical protein
MVLIYQYAKTPVTFHSAAAIDSPYWHPEKPERPCDRLGRNAI